MTSLSGGIALISLLAACGGDPDLTGMYQATYHTANDQDCTVEGPAVTEPPFFRFAEEEFFGQTYFQLSLCSGADEATCTGFAGSFLFAEPIDGGYRARYSSSSEGIDSCLLGYGVGTAVQEDDGVRVELRSYGEDVLGLTGDACSTDEAESRGESMPCESFEVMVGTLVPAG